MKEKQEIPIATTENVNHDNWHAHEDGPTVFTTARQLAGNMSPAYNQYDHDMDTEQKKAAAAEKLADALAANGIKQENAFIMLPQQSWSGELGVVNVDDEFAPGQPGDVPVVAKDRADLLITKNPEVALICRPADCPVLTLYGTDTDGNETLGLLHVGWQGLNAEYLEQGMQHFLDAGVAKESVRIQISGAGYAEHFHYKNAENPVDDTSHALTQDGTPAPKRFTHPDRAHLFVNVIKTENVNQQGLEIYEFDMDMPGFVRFKLDELGYSGYQVYEEGSDTARPDSGYSSHSRDAGDKTKNTRDAVLATLAKPDQELIGRHHERSAKKKGAIALGAAVL